jgi:hypothetical protein
MRRLGLLLTLASLSVPAGAQDVALEYQVKAAYLYNFAKLVDWPPAARTGPLTICVAGRNPFGEVLSDTLKGESIGGRPLNTRVILEPEPGCHVMFVPNGAAAATYLRAARGTPTLTVGESADFLSQGGVIAFVSEGRNVRFAISIEAAEQARLMVSARLLQLAINSPRSRP